MPKTATECPETSLDAQQAIVDLWLSDVKNDALLILKAFKIGLDEGRKRVQEERNDDAKDRE